MTTATAESGSTAPKSNRDSPSARHRTICHPLPLCRQQLRWECGLTSVLCILHAWQQRQGDWHTSHLSTIEQLRQNAAHCNESIWTIDLLYLLAQYLPPAALTMYTTCTGVSQQHSSSSFYTSVLAQDQQRITALFDAAGQEQLSINQHILSRAQVIERLAAGCVLLVLVDDGIMHCSNCKLHCALNTLQSNESHNTYHKHHYAGHYIIVNGVTIDHQSYLYVDVDDKSVQLSVSCELLDVARSADGTDSDIIVVQLPN